MDQSRTARFGESRQTANRGDGKTSDIQRRVEWCRRRQAAITILLQIAAATPANRPDQ